MRLTKAEQNRLVVEHQGFIRSCVADFWKRGHHHGLEFDDCVSEAMLAAVVAAADFDPSRAAFSTFLTTVVRRRLLNLARSARRKGGSDGCSDEIDVAADLPSPEDAIDAARFVERAARSPVLSRRLMGHSLHEIGAEEGVNKSTVMRRADLELAAIRDLAPDYATRIRPAVNLRQRGSEIPHVPAKDCPALVGRG
jgi:RNA polymerase sigma factor (sigma-70 family)